MKRAIKKSIPIPPGIEARIKEREVFIKGPLGELSNSFKLRKNVKMEKAQDKIEISCEKATKKEKKMINTVVSKINNMIRGVQKKYEYELQICSIHFPITVKIENGKFIISNFVGENKERSVAIKPGVDVKIEGDIVKVSSIDKEEAGTMAASIETASKIVGYDRRVFQDGIWIIKKEKGRMRND